ncbi:MAG: gliding motility-associated peptidyl-prolyl isomerase GldI [Flavobacteriales bacterium]|nr:MAG: gliding motility-associated peptidyl-prolyl isomerase GldI [Flavobacteriales bacterium]PIE48795.1 MAG: gliding motility-associated peptidyl-prolyl isomerase GldI [Flavobacteriales bacterium]
MKLYKLAILLVLIAACSSPEPRKPVVRKTGTFLKESIERNKIIKQIEEEVFKKYIELDSAATYINSDNGFWYTYIDKNTESDDLPNPGDEIFYTYSIALPNGEILYTREEIGNRNYIVDKQEVITGLQDGLKLMKAGESVKFLFPSFKAYGYSGYKKIASNQPLVYIVTVLNIKKTVPDA